MAEPVDWSTATRVGRLVARGDRLGSSYLADSLATDFERVTAESESLVRDFTRLDSPGIARAGVVDRSGWIDANVASMRRLLGSLNTHITDRLSTGPVGVLGRHTAGTELGVVLGYMSQRVLGQYDLLMGEVGDAADGDIVFYVGPNVLLLEKRFGFRPLEFRRWIAIHELTHRAQFTAVPWLRPYFLSLVDGMLGGIEPDPRALLRALARSAEALSRGKNPLDEAGLVGLFASDEQKDLLAKTQALMSLLEGHGNYVMNVLGAKHVHGVERMEKALHARRAVGGIAGQVNKALGLEMKLRQYEVGERFIKELVDIAGFAALDVAWSDPGALPTLPEFADAKMWLTRVDSTRVLRARDSR